jgi:archaellum component FlaD/FlaE
MSLLNFTEKKYGGTKSIIKTIEIYNKTCWISINKIKALHLFLNIKHNSHKLSKTKIQQYFQIEILITKTK